MNKNLYNEEEGLALLKLNENKFKGEMLKNIIRDIKLQIQEIEQFIQFNKKIQDNKETEKLLGKKGAEKYKQRMKKKYNNKININTKYNYINTYN